MEIMSGLITAFAKLKVLYVKVFKNGSVALALLIPLISLLTYFDLLPDDVIYIISTSVVVFAFAEVIFNLILKKYEETKARLADLNIAIRNNDTEAINKILADEKASYDVLKNQFATLLGSINDLITKKKTPEQVLSEIQEFQDNSELPASNTPEIITR